MKNLVVIAAMALSVALWSPSQQRSTSLSLGQVHGRASGPALLAQMSNGDILPVILQGATLTVLNGTATLAIPPGPQGPAGTVGPQGPPGSGGSSSPLMIDSFLIQCGATAQNCVANLPAQQFTTTKAVNESMEVYRNGLFLDPSNIATFANYTTSVQANIVTVTFVQPTADGDIITLRYR